MTDKKILELNVRTRDTTGKSAAARLRRQGEFPAVMYGHGSDAVHLRVNLREFSNALHSHGAAHSVMKLNLDNSKTGHTVVVKSVQRHPTRHDILHVDFQEVRMDEKVQATVPLALVGQAAGVKAGGTIQHGVFEVTVEALPAEIPEQVDVDVSALEIGDVLRVSDLPPYDNVSIVSPGDEVIASVLAPRVAAPEEIPKEEEEVPVEAVEEQAAEG